MFLFVFAGKFSSQAKDNFFFHDQCPGLVFRIITNIEMLSYRLK